MLKFSSRVFRHRVAFAFVEPFFIIGYLFSIAIFGLYQAIFMPTPAAPGTTPRDR